MTIKIKIRKTNIFWKDMEDTTLRCVHFFSLNEMKDIEIWEYLFDSQFSLGELEIEWDFFEAQHEDFVI